MSHAEPARSDLELVATRELDAPPGEAWRSWTDAELLQRWWGPNGFTCPTARMDVRVGGTSVVSMAAPQFGFPEMFSAWTYTAVEAPRRLEFDFRFSDADGAPVDPQSAGAPPGVPAVVHHTIAFDDLGDGRTRMTVRESGYTTRSRSSCRGRGWSSRSTSSSRCSTTPR